MQNIKLIISLIKKRGVFLLILILLVSLLELFSVAIISKFFETVTSNTLKNQEFEVFNLNLSFIEICIYCILALIFIAICSITSIYLINKKGIKIGFELAVQIFEMYLTDLSKIKNSNPNFFISKIYNETNRFATNVVVQSFHLLSKVLISVLIIGVLFYTDFRIASFSIIVIALTSYLFIYLTKNILKKNSKHITFLNNERLKILNETIGGIDYLKTYNKIDKQINYFRKTSFEFANAHSMNQTIQSVPKYILETVLIVSLISYALYLNYTNELQSFSSVLFLFGAAGLKLLPSINLIINSISKIRANLDSLRAIEDDLKLISLPKTLIDEDKNKIESLNSIQVRIDEFSFSEDKILFKDVNFDLTKGNWYLLKGESGKGKSTLLRLILNIYKVTNGKILVNNTDLDSYDLTSFYSKIGYVSQNIFLFEGSIDFNISLEENPNMEKLNLLKESCNIDFGDTELYNLSGGQTQRVGIARALYKEYDFLIIDEAFTGLDKENSKKIRSLIKNISNNKIVVEINHNELCTEITEEINL